MNVYGKMNGHDYWIFLAKNQTPAQYYTFSTTTAHHWGETHYGASLPAGQQTIGQSLGYAS